MHNRQKLLITVLPYTTKFFKVFHIWDKKTERANVSYKQFYLCWLLWQTPLILKSMFFRKIDVFFYVNHFLNTLTKKHWFFFWCTSLLRNWDFNHNFTPLFTNTITFCVKVTVLTAAWIRLWIEYKHKPYLKKILTKLFSFVLWILWIWVESL